MIWLALVIKAAIPRVLRTWSGDYKPVSVLEALMLPPRASYERHGVLQFSSLITSIDI
jgi:hypothetical protein